MVTGFTEWERPSWLPAREWTPAQEWGRITGRQDPYWEARAPMEQLGQRLQARYLLGAPGMISGDWSVEPTFEDYIGSFIGGLGAGQSGGMPWRANTYEALLGRAQQAAAATRRPVGEYMTGFGDPESDPYREAAWYAGMFNPTQTQSAAENQLAAATLLAQQRQGAGTPYTGAMGRAIANALAEQQRYRQDIGRPEGTFLDWYLSQRNGAAA